jgi:hypothetical protein
MTRQEKWMDIVNRIKELGDELNELAESVESGSIESIDHSIFSLHVAIDEIHSIKYSISQL